MADKSASAPKPAKPAGKSEQQAAEESTKDGLTAGRENTMSRKEVREQKTPQGQSNKG